MHIHRLIKVLHTLKMKTSLLDIALLLIFSLLPFWNIGFSGTWQAFDQGFPYFPFENLQDKLYLWNYPSESCGVSGLIFISGLPGIAINAGLAFLGLPPNIIQRLLLLFFTFLTGWSMYYLICTLFHFENEAIKRVAGITAGISYIINPFTTFWMTLGVYPIGTLFAVPLLLAFIHKGFETSKVRGSWVKYALLASFLTLFVGGNPELLLILSFLPVTYIISVIIIDLCSKLFQNLLNHLKFIGLFILVSLMLNAYWLIPTVYVVSQGYQLIPETHVQIERLESFANRPLPFIQILRLHIFRFQSDYPPYPLGLWITSLPIIALDLMLFCSSIIVLLLRPKDKFVTFFVIVTVLAIGLANGILPPLGSLYLWLVNNVPLFSILTDPNKFLYLAIIGYSTLIGIFASEIFKRLSTWKIMFIFEKANGSSVTLMPSSPKVMPKIFVCALIFLILVRSYPLLSGNLYGWLAPIDIPNYYLEARNWLKNEGSNFRVAKVPLPPPGLSPHYTWLPDGYSISISVLWSIVRFNVPVMDNNYQQIATVINSLILDNKTEYLGKAISLWNVKYVIVANDLVDASTRKRINIENINLILSRQRDLKPVKIFGELTFYENLAYSDDLIYGASTYLVLPKQTIWDKYLALCDKQDFHPAKFVLFSSDDVPTVLQNSSKIIEINDQVLNKWNIKDTDHELPIINYEKINPTKYIVHINTEEPFVLILSERYDHLWRAVINGTDRELPHFIANFYANGWFINNTGQYEVILEYSPQKNLDIGLLVSTLTVINSTGFLMVIFVKKYLRSFLHRH